MGRDVKDWVERKEEVGMGLTTHVLTYIYADIEIPRGLGRVGKG